jgi:hypothetical protein
MYFADLRLQPENLTWCTLPNREELLEQYVDVVIPFLTNSVWYCVCVRHDQLLRPPPQPLLLLLHPSPFVWPSRRAEFVWYVYNIPYSWVYKLVRPKAATAPFILNDVWCMVPRQGREIACTHRKTLALNTQKNIKPKI